jgi:hypothetical protein
MHERLDPQKDSVDEGDGIHRVTSETPHRADVL